MTDFGFTIAKSSTFRLDDADTGLYERLCVLDPDVMSCISCGSCSATCMASKYSRMSVRKMILALQRGQKLGSMLSNCMLCGKCSMVCPRGINTRKLILDVCSLYDR